MPVPTHAHARAYAIGLIEQACVPLDSMATKELLAWRILMSLPDRGAVRLLGMSTTACIDWMNEAFHCNGRP